MLNLDNVTTRNKIVIPMIVIGIIGGVVMYSYFSSLYKQSQIDALVGKARAVVLSAESAREYTADQSKHKVFQPSSSITKLDDLLYTVPIFSAMQVAKKKSNELGFTVKVPKNQPRNPENQPDEYEKMVLEKLSNKETKEFWEIDKATNQVRYFRPVVLTEECLACHGDPNKSFEYWGRNDGKDITGVTMEGWKAGEVHGAFEIKMKMDEVDKAVADNSLIIAIIVGFISFLTILIAILVSRNITKGVLKIREQLEMMTKSVLNGNLETRGLAETVSVDFRPIITNTNSLIEAFVEPIQATSEYISTISKGVLPDKISSEYKGDFNEIKENVNNLIENLDVFVKEMNNMGNQHDLGDIDVFMDEHKFQGCYKDMAIGLNSMVKGHIDVKKKAMSVVENYGNGNFDVKMETLPGKKVFINNILDKVQFNLMTFGDDMEVIINEIKNGHLDVRNDTSKYQGDWMVLAKGINEMLEAVIQPLDLTADYIDRISKGDIPEKITLDYKGDFNEIKLNLNNLIEANFNIIESFQKIGDGDLCVKLTMRSPNDTLILSINELTSSLSNLIKQIAESVEQNSISANQMSTNAESLTVASQEQSAQTDEVAGAVEEMSRTVTESSHSANRTSEVATKNGNIAIEGGKVVKQTITKMHDIANVVINSAANIQQLGERSKEIGEIISVIDDIADQTNLLALNAAIEAARAGEQGRGFAVVADEVRKLAERTTEATKQIANMIKTIQKETETAVETMNKGSIEVQNGIELADLAGAALNEVVSSSTEVSEMISLIVISSEQQAATSEQIAKNIIEISKVTLESNLRIEEIAQASDDLTKLTENLKETVSLFKYQEDDNSKNSNNRSSINSSYVNGKVKPSNGVKLLTNN